ncbi:S41 family peptidase [Bryobacter aggregatus]|uniref:S41 family peptidase n=1 Tax=Bryobacter aggregatus TaxID=360054 RepID=UPI0004E15E01|nr:S41 family peptidase [Bryobacter aggregatus]
MRRLLTAILPMALCAQEDPSGLAEHIRRFTQVYGLVEANAAEPISAGRAFEEGAIPAMLRKLDPHSIFFNKDQFQQLREMETSTRKGFGTIVSVLPGRVIVLQTMPGSPSQRAGLSAGDEIIAVNNVALSRFDTEQMVEFLAYSRQKDALLAVRRQNFPRPLEFVLSPATLDAPTVDRAYELKPGIGYIRVASFEDKTGRDLQRAIEKLGGKQLKGLVLDLRNNPGGVFSSALEAASLFLPAGTRLTSIRGRSKKEENIDVPAENDPYTFPLAVLMNEKSASGSEVVAGALQDHKRATIVGTTSYGKGLVQSVFPISNGDGLALTTAYYYTPKGRSIQRRYEGAQIDPNLNTAKAGIEPDVVQGPEPGTRLRHFIDANGLFVAFATEWLQRNPKPQPGYRMPANTLDQFQQWLSAHQVQPTLAEWSVDRAWIANRLEQELVNLSLGVEKGDEIEAIRDPQIQAALSQIAR